MKMILALFAVGLMVLMGAAGVVSAQQETAWAGDYEFPGRNWSLYMMYNVHCDPSCYMAQHNTLWAGQNTAVGEVLVGHQAGENDVWIRYEMADGWCLVETHATFGYEFDEIPMTGSGNPKIGHFMYNDTHPPCTHVVNYVFEIPDDFCEADIYLAAHAVVEPCTCDLQSEGDARVFGNLPSEFKLDEPYPNPFNASATVSVTLPEAAPLTINVFSVTGQQVATLTEGMSNAGTHQFHFDAANLASGVYFVQATVPGKLNELKKVMLVR
ncbi:T9SS type A sorting domain-containing protein [bacterium]|nr:T9SS type A sorting domain-containing protein [bacterium]